MSFCFSLGCLAAYADQINSLPKALTGNDFIAFDAKQARLGRLLFYDKVLSGNRNISCGTCHHHDHGSADGLSLGVGEGGEGVGPKRTAGQGASRIKKRIPRNAPGMWNLGAKEISVLFHDGRLSPSDLYENGFNSPAEEWFPKGFTNLLAAQAILPLSSQFEMAGNPKENEIAGAIHDRIDKAWPIIAKRVRTIPEYGRLFVEAFDHINSPDQVSVVEVGEALAAFAGTEWQSTDAPFDEFLKGNKDALTGAARRGLGLFYGKAGCASCHSGPLLTDHKFYALALPPIGPGRTRQFDPAARDVGFMGESDRLEDAYRFRTPSLRNVALTAPYGHNGTIHTLRAMIDHHVDPLQSLAQWDKANLTLPKAPWLSVIDFITLQDQREMKRIRSRVDIDLPDLPDSARNDLVAFLHTLTGKTAKTPPLGRPDTVPSGLPVD